MIILFKISVAYRDLRISISPRFLPFLCARIQTVRSRTSTSNMSGFWLRAQCSFNIDTGTAVFGFLQSVLSFIPTVYTCAFGYLLSRSLFPEIQLRSQRVSAPHLYGRPKREQKTTRIARHIDCELPLKIFVSTKTCQLSAPK